jgi:hypothetical protein
VLVPLPAQPQPSLAAGDTETLEDLGLAEPEPVPTDTPPDPPTSDGPSV